MPAGIPIVDLAAEYAEVGSAVEAEVIRVLRSGRWILGEETAAFEQEMAELVGTRFAVGVGSGTEALILALMAVGVGPGDEVVTTPFTFFATAEAIVWTGANPVFVDIEPGGFNLDPAGLEAAITQHTRAIVPVHLFGRIADMQRIRAIADAAGVPVVEDAAQAVGATRGGRGAGAWGQLGCFSFYPSKNLGAAGDAGCITTDDADLAERARLLRFHGSGGGPEHRLIGTTSRLDSLQAAVLRAKLPSLERWSKARSRNAGLYRELLSGCPDLRLPEVEPAEVAVWNQYTLRSPRAPALRAALEAEDIAWRHFYARPVYQEPALGWLEPRPSCPEAERACAEVLSIPVHPFLTSAEVERVAGVLRAALGSASG